MQFIEKFHVKLGAALVSNDKFYRNFGSTTSMKTFKGIMLYKTFQAKNLTTLSLPSKFYESYEYNVDLGNSATNICVNGEF